MWSLPTEPETQHGNTTFAHSACWCRCKFVCMFVSISDSVDRPVSRRCAGLSTCVLGKLSQDIHKLQTYPRTNVGAGTPGRKRSLPEQYQNYGSPYNWNCPSHRPSAFPSDRCSRMTIQLCGQSHETPFLFFNHHFINDRSVVEEKKFSYNKIYKQPKILMLFVSVAATILLQ